ncbi:MAG TPA: hypothetical protein VHB20_16650 [Verrucomicrobiae bacterium]|jgi:WD40 repeat protein|nr:hypothetical protein [Verrucomicrobiae bacterium]
MRKGALIIILGLAAARVFGQGSPSIIWQQTVDSDRVNALQFTSDGSVLITGSSDRLIHRYNAADGTVIQTLDSGAPDIHNSSIESLSVNSAGTMLATVNYQQLKLWDLPSGAEHAITADTDWDVWCNFSPDGRWIATASFDSLIKIWNTDGALLKTFTSGALQRAVAFSPNGQWLASAGGDNFVTVRSTADWSVVATLTGHTSDIYVLKFSPDSSMIATGSYDDSCRVWNTSDWSPRFTFANGGSPVYAVAFSPDSGTLAYSEGDNGLNRLALVSMGSGATIHVYDQNVPNVQCLDFSPTTGNLAIGRADDTVEVADVGVSGSGGGGGGGGPSLGELTVNINGDGRVSPNRNGQTLSDGKRYTLTAAPIAGNLFVNWTDGSGNVVAKSAALTFTMQDGLTLNANFTPNPFVPVAGLYEGLITSQPASAEGSGRINVTVTSAGTFSGGIWFNGAPRSIAGRFQADGSFTGTFGAWQITLQVDITSGTDQVTGSISDGNVTSSISADRLVWNARSNPAPAGRFTAWIQPDTNQGDSPQGYGYAYVTIATSGLVTTSGRLADGAPFVETAYLSKNMTWPLYVAVSGAREVIAGEITLEQSEGGDFDGAISWFRSGINGAAYYPNGFSAQISLLGSAIVPGAHGQSALSFGSTDNDNASVTINGADVPGLSFSGILSGNGRFTVDAGSNPPNGFVLSVGQTGSWSGSFIDPTTGRRVSFVGYVSQKQNKAAGYFLSSGQSGSIVLSPTQ